MGYSLSWTAVRGKSASQILGELALRGTGEHEEIPESALVGAELPGGWYVIIANKEDPCATDGTLARLSTGCEVVTCGIVEGAMYSEATEWKNGKEIWSVFHDSEQSIDHLKMEGDFPSALPSIRDRLSAEQEKAGGKKAGVDFFFDVPVELARAITGFHHSEGSPETEDDVYEVLATLSDQPATVTTPPKSSWVKKLFGGKA